MTPHSSSPHSLWHDAARVHDLHDFIATAARALARQMPLHHMVLYALSHEQTAWEAYAFWAADTKKGRPPARIPCTPATRNALDLWCNKTRLILRSSFAHAPAPLRPLLASHDECSFLCAHLRADATPSAILLLFAQPTFSFDATHKALLNEALPPLNVLWQKHRDIHALTTEKNAVEAEKHALLTRLGARTATSEIIGARGGLAQLMSRVQHVAPLNVPVLILGETGAGKEVIAREIHRLSSRHNAAFVRVNCGAIPPELIDSHLFGHEKGAFTGATDTRKGWFERADGGTLFLDEIGELPLPAQVRLLHALQDGWIERVGGHTPIHVDVRLIAATHRDLPTAVAEKTFREDLWYRIATFPLRLPALRERPEDIPALARHFSARAATRFFLASVEPTEAQIALLTSYHWPGNVREFAAVIDRAAILGNGTHLAIEKALGITPTASAHTALPATVLFEDEDFPSLDTVTARHITAALTRTRGRVQGPRGAAKLLKVHPSTLRARMRKLHIDWRAFMDV